VNHQLLVRPEAESDFTQAFDWYEVRKPGLGFEFIEAVDHALSTIQKNPLVFATLHRKARRILLKRFPYCIYFVFDADVISVIACFHAKRAPSVWKSRVP
jgi:plasmid stabilization system protein ParE